MRVLAALSGGVDSAVAAALAADAGHDVIAVHLALSSRPAAFRDGARGCCSLEDARDARRAADVLGLPFYVWDFAERFRAEVVDDFVAEYAAGRTPNPCIRCNERIKFAALLERGLALGFDAVCTGHYARLDVDASGGGGGVRLRRAVDTAKDQSYVLATLAPTVLAHALFPVGAMTKDEVRAEAARRGLLVADKPDSTDLCFVPTGDTAGFLGERLGAEPGPVVDVTTGRTVGRHDGAHRFTVGQRRGLALGRPAADGRPRYVVGVDPAAATVLVGPAELLGVDVVVSQPPSWCGPVPGPGARVTAQLRAHGEPVGARVDAAGDGVVTTLDRERRGVAAGQTIAWYDGDRVLGGATIAAARRRRGAPAPEGIAAGSAPGPAAAGRR